MMALELFKPFVMKRLIETQMAQNIKSAKRMVDVARPGCVGRARRGHLRTPVLLSRARPARLGIPGLRAGVGGRQKPFRSPPRLQGLYLDSTVTRMAGALPLSAEARARKPPS